MGQPSARTVRRLIAVSGNRCPFPNCPSPVVDAASGTIVAEVAHIKADNPGGPRYDSNQSEEERQSFENVILMCSMHHHVIDQNPETYTVERLVEMKTAHEARHQQQQILMIAPAALKSLGVEPDDSDDEILREIEEDLATANLQSRRGTEGDPPPDGYVMCIMYPARYSSSRFTREQLRRAAFNGSVNLVGLPFLWYDPNSQSTANVREGIRTLFAGGDHFDYWTLRRSGLLVLRSLMREDAMGARDENGRRLLDPRWLVAQLTGAVVTLHRLYESLGVGTGEEITFRFWLTETADRILRPLPRREAFFFGRGYVASDDEIYVVKRQPLGDWAATVEDSAAEFATEIVQLFQWNPSRPDTLRAWAERTLRGSMD